MGVSLTAVCSLGKNFPWLNLAKLLSLILLCCPLLKHPLQCMMHFSSKDASKKKKVRFAPFY